MRFASLVLVSSALVLSSAAAAVRAERLPPAPAASPVPSAAPASAGDGGLTVIRRVRVATPFCTALHDDAAPAADAAERFEDDQLLVMADVLRFAYAGDVMSKMRLRTRVEDDLRALGDLSHEGGASLDGLRSLAVDPSATTDERVAVLGLRNALAGAKGRQYFMTTKLSGLVATIDQQPPRAASDGEAAAYSRALGPAGSGLSLAAAKAIHAMLPEGVDDAIRDDLATAGARARTAVVLGACDDGSSDDTTAAAPAAAGAASAP